MLEPVTAEQIKAYREAHSVGLFEAQNAVRKRHLVAALAIAKTVDDLREIIAVMLEDY